MPCALCSNVNTIRILYQSPLHHILCTMVIMYRYVVTSVLKKQQISLIHVYVVLVCLDLLNKRIKIKEGAGLQKETKWAIPLCWSDLKYLLIFMQTNSVLQVVVTEMYFWQKIYYLNKCKTSTTYNGGGAKKKAKNKEVEFRKT